MLVPFRRMKERLDLSREDSDTALFYDLMSYGEMVMKFAIAGAVATIRDDRNRSRYRQVYRLVRASGVGEWDDVAEEVLFGTASQYIVAEARDVQKDLSQRLADDAWQNQSVTLLRSALQFFDETVESLPAKVNARLWFKFFARLRNAVKHGSPAAEIVSRACHPLEASIDLFASNAVIFRREWAHLKRNYSGKYRVSAISTEAASFEYLKKSTIEQHQDGTYLFADKPRPVELVESDAALGDFFIANGGFSSTRYERLSYVTGEKNFGDASDYQVPADELPLSTTHGFGDLEVKHKCLSNVPPPENDYVSRSDLERELLEHLADRELHRVITLHGRGGVGKTSLALKVLDDVARTERYSSIIWFSARDIDLLSDGPKPVKPQVFTTKEMAREFCRLVGVVVSKDDAALAEFSQALTTQHFGPTLFVFDNFETIENPPAAFQWIDTYVRHPNKALITARHREFKGDFPIEVFGMTEDEAGELIGRQAGRLGVSSLITPKYREDLFRESDGHPYVIKILLGEVARLGRAVAIERIISDREEILTALFERTFAKLSPAAQRVFLTVSSWRSSIPTVALQAALLRSSDERIDADGAVDELVKYSFVERMKSDVDGSYFVVAPVAAAAFARKKLTVNPAKTAIEVDVRFLQLLGPGQREDVRRGLGPRVERLLRNLTENGFSVSGSDSEFIRVLQFLGGKYPPLWMWLSERCEAEGDYEHAKEYVRRYVEAGGTQAVVAWERLADLSKKCNDIAGEITSLVAMGEAGRSDLRLVSRAANRLNSLFRDKSIPVDSEEKRILILRLIEVFEAVAAEAGPNDLSRLAWLKLNAKDESGARLHVERGLAVDPTNTHLRNLAARLHLKTDGDTGLT